MLAHPGAVFREQRQRLLVGFTQLRAVLHRVQVADRREDTAQAIVHLCQRLAEVVPGVGCPLSYHALYRFAAILKRFRHGGNHMLRFNLGKRRQVEGRQ